MSARVKAWLEILGDLFWLRPALVVLGCILLAKLGVWLETAHVAGYDASSPNPNWGYSGGAEGARALLSAVASSSIGVAGTIFSITIAALTLASGQMGPRLLRNFIRDARNQMVLGIFLGTFAYALMVLRTVRPWRRARSSRTWGSPARWCWRCCRVGTLVWFVHHIATTINVETVVDAVHRDLIEAIDGTTRGTPPARLSRPERRPEGRSAATAAATCRPSTRKDWPTGRTRRRRGPPAGAARAITCRAASRSRSCLPAVAGREAAIRRALTFGRRPAALQDLEYSVRQLVEIAVRALSPGHQRPVHRRQRAGPLRRRPLPHRAAASADRGGRSARARSWSSFR